MAEGPTQIVDTFGRLVEKHCPRGTGAAAIGREDGNLWSALVEGGWLDVGARNLGSDALPLPVLALLCVEWGRRLPALPFVSSVVARRWFGVVAHATQTFAIPAGDKFLIPFGNAAPLYDDSGAQVTAQGHLDSFAASLPVVRAHNAGALEGGKESELRLLYAATALGAALEAFDRGVAYTQERFAYGKPVSGFQALRHFMADMHLDLELARSALLWASLAEGTDRLRATGEVTRLSQGVVAKSIQLFGGIGFTWDLGQHFYLRHTIAVRELCAAPAAPGERKSHISYLKLDERAEKFRDEVRSWLSKAVPADWSETSRKAAEENGNAIRRKWATILHSGGYSGLRWPKEYGGCGLGPVEAAIFYEECARAQAPESVDNSPRSVGVTLAGPAIIAYGTDAQKRRHLPKILDASEIWCEGFSEPGAGSDLAAVSTVATLDGDVFRVNGSKIWTTHAHEADHCYLLAKTSPDAPRHHNLSVFLFNMRQPGVTVMPLENIAGEHEFNQVFFDNAVAQKEDLLGELNGGWKLVTIGAAALRSSGGDGGTSVYWSRYVQMSSLLERLEGNARIDRAILRKLRAQLDTLWWTNARAAGAVGEEEGYPAIRGGSNILKIALSELLQEIAAVGLEFTRPEDLAFWRREYLMSRSRSIAGGTSQIQRNVIADQVLRLRKA